MDYDNAWLQSVFDERLPAAGYTIREEQLAMANFVQTALLKNRHLLAEAGVGTGKTFAYLIPAIGRLMRTNMPVIVATHTIALQEQLVNKDIPALRELLGLPIQTLLAKGKEHYLCPAREMRFREKTPEPDADTARLLQWARRTRTGDRSEIPHIPEALWKQINMDERSRCAGCRYEWTCPTAGTRRKWQGADGLLVTNHHQFFADLAMRARGHSLFAQPSAIVLDEAHAVADTAREILGHQAAVGGLLPAIEAGARQLREGDRSWQAAKRHAEAFLQLLPPRIRWSASDEATKFGIDTDAPLSACVEALETALQRMLANLGGLNESPARHAAIERLEAVAGAARGLLSPERYIQWVEAPRGKPRQGVSGLTLANAPRDLAGILRGRLFGRGCPVILTSATLAAAEDFSYLQHELGVEKPLQCAVGSPFDYERQARLYMPDDLPDPGQHQDAFYEAALERLKQLLEATDGRALVLFTAKSRSAAAYQALKAWGRFPVLHQDRADPGLIDRFKQETRSVLVGTGYWEGIDVPGETLSCVVVVKLPFSPEDPLVEAKREAAIARGEDPFEAVLLPEMLLKLKQGTGRLIRRASDRGVIAILDPRATTRERYAEEIALSLPPAPHVQSLEQVRAFLAER